MRRVLSEDPGKLNEIPSSAPIRLGEPPQWGAVMILSGELPSADSSILSHRQRASSSADTPIEQSRLRTSKFGRLKALAPLDALAPSGQESRDSSQDLGRFQPLSGVSDLWVARSGTMPQADLDSLL